MSLILWNQLQKTAAAKEKPKPITNCNVKHNASWYKHEQLCLIPQIATINKMKSVKNTPAV